MCQHMVFVFLFLTLRSTGQVICRMPFSRETCLIFLSCLHWGYGVWGGSPEWQSTIFTTSYLGYILSTGYITVDVYHDHLADQCLSGFSTVRLLLLPPHPPLSMFYLKNRELHSFSLREEYLHQLFIHYFSVHLFIIGFPSLPYSPNLEKQQNTNNNKKQLLGTVQ